jgi:hypothetical protein
VNKGGEGENRGRAHVSRAQSGDERVGKKQADLCMSTKVLCLNVVCGVFWPRNCANKYVVKNNLTGSLSHNTGWKVKLLG